MLKVFLVDDEPDATEAMELMLKNYCKDVEVAGIAHGVQDAVSRIPEVGPDVLFLDVEMPDGGGFEVLKQLPDRDFEVIFSTAFDQYAVKAFKYSAFDYLLKPVDIDELVDSLQRIKETRISGHAGAKVNGLLDNLNGHQPDKLTISTSEGIHFIPVSDLVRIEGSGNYSTFHLNSGEKIMASRNLGEFEDILTDGFFRSHQSHMVNLSAVRSYMKDSGQIEMSDGSFVSLARRKKDLFLELMDQIG